MMRQYELVERVRRYNPNADEDLLNRAYVFAMKAHGSQKRASGDPYFSHPLEVAAILTELKVDDPTIVAAMLHDTIEDTRHHARGCRQVVRRRDRRARRRPDQARQARLRHQARAASREFPQTAARDRRRRPRPPGEARRSPAQYAHAQVHAGGQAAPASPRIRSTSTPRSPAAWACRACAANSRTSPFAA